jgi:hypothetical protein
MMQAITKVVHENLKPEAAFDLYETLKHQESKKGRAL